MAKAKKRGAAKATTSRVKKKRTAKTLAPKKAAPKKVSRLKRPKNSMPPWVKRALVARRLMSAYEERPDFQKNDYLWWIGSAKRESTRDKRLAQMLDELDNGAVYMNMPWRPLRRR